MGVSTAVSVHPVILTVCSLSRKRDEETKLFLITWTASGYIQRYCPLHRSLEEYHAHRQFRRVNFSAHAVDKTPLEEFCCCYKVIFGSKPRTQLTFV